MEELIKNMKKFTNSGQFIKGNVASRKGTSFVFPDMTGQRFGRWTVLREMRKGNWLCKCDCGTEKRLTGYSLRRGNPKSCGCITIEKLKQKTLPDNLSAKNKIFYEYKKNALKRKINFTILFEDLLLYIGKNCYYCGSKPSNMIKPNHRNKSITFKYNGIDRLDNNKGYEKNNIVPCCKLCNQAKMDLSYKDFLTLIEKIYNKHKKT
jgi:hypothetical protein